MDSQVVALQASAIFFCSSVELVIMRMARNFVVINGHLTATTKDTLEIENWTKALQRSGSKFPYINSTKSLVGHCLAAAGAIECVASVIQLNEQFVAPNINCEDLHSDIEDIISREQIPTEKLNLNFDVIAKASFGFGDVNSCVIFQKYFL